MSNFRFIGVLVATVLPHRCQAFAFRIRKPPTGIETSAQIVRICRRRASTAILSRTMSSSSPTPSDRRMLTRVAPSEVSLEKKSPVDPDALVQAKAIMSEIQIAGGTVDPAALMDVARRLGDVPPDHEGGLIVSKEECKAAYDNLGERDRAALTNIHDRVKRFAEAQRSSVTDMEMDIPGGKAGHTVSPCRGAFYSFARGGRLSPPPPLTRGCRRSTHPAHA